MKNLEQVTKELAWLGEVIELQSIGIYQIATYKEKDFDTKKITKNICYQGYVNGVEVLREVFSDFETCLVCNIAKHLGDPKGDAGKYFIKMIG
jgi:hypothetical protein